VALFAMLRAKILFATIEHDPLSVDI